SLIRRSPPPFLSSSLLILFSQSHLPHRPPHSFPTRRSSDLNAPDIVVALHWSPDKSSNGTPGLVFCDESGRKPGQGMHVTLSQLDRKSTRLNSSHGSISYAVFCLKKKKQKK